MTESIASFRTLYRRQKDMHDATLLSTEKTFEIEAICTGLIGKYGYGKNFDFQGVFNDHNIRYLENERVVEAASIHFKKSPVILVPDYGTKRFRDHLKGHELGHVLLGHKGELSEVQKTSREHEAEYFSHKILGSYSFFWKTLQTIDWVLRDEKTDPYRAYKKEYEADKERYLLKLIKMADAESQ